MAAPDTILTQAEFEARIGAEKLVQLLPAPGGKIADTTRVQVVLYDARGAVFGGLQIALQPLSVDQLWDTWEEKDKAEIKRLIARAAVYYAHYWGRKQEDIPESVLDDWHALMGNGEPNRGDVYILGARLRTLGTDKAPKSSQQNEARFLLGAGRSPAGSPRSRWRYF